ncbi:MAG: dTDP-4-dehydrorhamnose 3,5-epimerase family protein [Acidobacteria bacterium]|nr:dTDP-4-dehydrorhamnose 3,5-epimerase family protein [Acidobacteriota bacterium]MCA1638734.1 dTDP-4-dehydrorhamnose 3,5-epimerase family protein [Acidobacteriota bacterium]
MTKTEQEKKLFTKGKIHDVVIYPLRKFVDERGWLAELFRHDELEEEFYPAMVYISVTEPNVQRGPHEHETQADLFCFIGAGNFKLRMWDNRAESPTFRNVMTMFVGADNPQAVIIPKGIVHAYKNISATEKGVVINCPNRLFMGEGKREEIDEIRHEDDPDSIFRMED